MSNPDEAPEQRPAPDPDPAETAGLDRGGGVTPGDVPPVESSTAAAWGHDEGGGGSPARQWAMVVLLVAVTLAVGLLMLFWALLRA